MSVRLGEILVKESLITQDQLQKALEFQRANGGKLGSCLTKLGFITDDDITGVLSRQYGVPSINLNSNMQLLDAFSKLGVDVPDTMESTLVKYDHPAIKKLLEYRGHEKTLSAFGAGKRSLHAEPDDENRGKSPEQVPSHVTGERPAQIGLRRVARPGELDAPQAEAL